MDKPFGVAHDSYSSKPMIRRTKIKFHLPGKSHLIFQFCFIIGYCRYMHGVISMAISMALAADVEVELHPNHYVLEGQNFEKEGVKTQVFDPMSYS